MRFAEKIESVKKEILGKEYSLSTAYVSEAKSRELNKKYRKKDKATNVLSFALGKNTGELVLCKSIIQKEAKSKKFGKNFPELLVFLVIHGMLHLNGMKHSATMEKAEEKHYEKYFGGHRHGLFRDQSRSGRIFKRRKKS